MAVVRSYMMRDKDGRETGPFDQEALVRLAENGEVTPLHEVRSTLLPQWEQAGSVGFLKDILRRKMDAIRHPKPSLLRRLARRATRRCDIGPLRRDDRTLRHSRAGLLPRFLAGVTDLAVLLPLALLAVLLGFLLVKNDALGPDEAGPGMVAAAGLLYFLYYLVTISRSTQTVGQKAWGIFLMRGDDDLPFYAGRIFLYALLLPMFAVLTPLTMRTTPSGRSWQEALSGLTMVKVKFNRSAK